MYETTLNVKFWILKLMHQTGFEPSIFDTEVLNDNHYTTKAGLVHRILALT